jgi:hypothetical protein
MIVVTLIAEVLHGFFMRPYAALEAVCQTRTQGLQ